MAPEVEVHDMAGAKISSPSFIPSAFKRISRESVPFAHAIQYFDPMYSENDFSNFATCAPL